MKQCVYICLLNTLKKEKKRSNTHTHNTEINDLYTKYTITLIYKYIHTRKKNMT